MTLAQYRQHLVAKIGEMRVAPFAPDELAAQFKFKLLDGPRQSGLGDIALFCGARKIERSRHRSEIANLLHFHQNFPWPH